MIAALLLASLAGAMPADRPARVVTLAPHLAELVCVAGGCRQLVGVVSHSDWPPEVQNMPLVGDAFRIDTEHLLRLQPDLILAWDGGTPPRLAERLRRLDLRVAWITIRRVEEIADALERVGTLLGTEAQARAAARRFRQRLGEIRARYAAQSPVATLYQVQLDPIFTVGRDSPISEAITLCGGRNIFEDLASVAAPVSLESVLARRPQVVVYPLEEGHARVREFWSRWAALPATSGGHLYAMDASLLARPAPRMLQGVDQLCAAIARARS